MTIKNSTRLLAILLTLAMMLPFASCNFGTGSLKLESLIVDPNSVKTEYVVGEAIDFSGIQVIAKYTDENLNKVYTFSELTISYDADITATTGDKEVTVSFEDPNLGVKQEVKVTIKVVAAIDATTTEAPVETTTVAPQETTTEAPQETTTPEPGETTEVPTETTTEAPQETTTEAPVETTTEAPEETTPAEIEEEIIGFDTPSTLVHFAEVNKTAGTLNYGDNGFAGQFAVGGQIYVIGNQNEFKLTPTVEILNFNTDKEYTTKEFFADVTISLQKDGNYVELAKVYKGNNVTEYYDGNVLVATVNTYKGLYQFSAEAAGNQVKISVAPSQKYYEVYEEDFPPIVLEAKIINAYNVYEAWQLAVIDNFNAAWADFKAAHGIANVSASGIVLHNDIKLTADDAPASFFYTTTADVVYTNTVSGATITIPAGTKYLVDETFIYERRSDEDFAIEGNFFTLDAKSFPLVPSPGVFGKDSGRDYEYDFSNAALFRVLVAEETTELTANATVNNIQLIGNAARDNLVDSTESLASAGGLIFFKSSVGINTTMNNIIGNSYFITYFTEYKTSLTVKNSKCYDSYQNAAFMWGDATLNLIDTYINGCGGPAIIAQSVWNENRHPVVNVTGGEIETHLGGQEIWFTAVQATAIVGQIKALGAGLQQAGLGNLTDANGQLNIKTALMAKGFSADEIVSGLDAQGIVSINGAGMDRFQTPENAHWITIYQISQYAATMSGQMPPFFTVYDAQGTAYTIYYNGVTFVDLAGNALGTDASHMALAAAFMQANTITLTQGGLSVVFEFYH